MSTFLLKDFPWYMSFLLLTFWLAHLFCLWVYGIISLPLQFEHVRECTNAKQRFMLGQIPARGARASWVHHCRTHGSGARLCSEVLCYLAYFSTISNGPVPNRSSSCELMLDRGGERVERISQRENGQPCQGWGTHFDTLWTDDGDLCVGQQRSARRMDDLIQEGSAGLCWPAPILLEM